MADEFKVHRLNARGFAKAEIIARIFEDTLADIDDNIPQGRERQIVVTKLQEAAFFAKRSISNDPAYQEQEEPE